jgi:hypothetical protein
VLKEYTKAYIHPFFVPACDKKYILKTNERDQRRRSLKMEHTNKL